MRLAEMERGTGIYPVLEAKAGAPPIVLQRDEANAIIYRLAYPFVWVRPNGSKTALSM